jgi:anti-sigma regulatory factor (Ser/Thr protein kinase)
VEEMTNQHATQKMFTVAHASDVSNVRRSAIQLAESLGFGETTSGKLAIVITEAATNILKHAVSGTVLIAPVGAGEMTGIEIIAFDRGVGMSNLTQSRRDGISSSGTSGTGLGAMSRLSDDFDIYSSPNKGTVIYMLVLAQQGKSDKSPLQVGAVCVPVAGEDECGDAWAYAYERDAITIVVADGLGHGPDAAVASNAAIKTLQLRPDQPPGKLLHAMHETLRPTRGAAVAVMRLDLMQKQLCFAGIGNITACVMDSTVRKQLVSHNGIVGNNMRKVQEFSLPWANGMLAVMCSDGIGTQWDLDKYPGLYSRHPALIAAVIYRDFVRVRDDATVVAVRYQ